MTDTPFLSDGYHAVAPGKLANVVTFLEMTEPPVRPPRPAPASQPLAPFGLCVIRQARSASPLATTQ